MKKALLTLSVIFYTILYSASLLYIGYEYGESAQYPYPNGPEYYILPAIYLILLVISVFLVHRWEYSESKSYYKMGIFTLAYGCLTWGSRLFFYFQGRMTMSDYLDIYVYPGVVFVFSVIISVIYFVCGAKTQRENEST